MVGPAAAGTAIGPYRLLQIAGQGGMGEVWLAEQKEPVRRRVALKLIKAGMDTREVIARFDSERQALALMDHPAIAKVFEAGSTPEGRPYFAMEYVAGIAITDYCDKHKLTLRERLELFAHVCEGVQHAHQKGIIHRDLKPSNILVSEVDGRARPKIIDFGVAKAMAQRLTDETMLTRLGTVIGTLEYMSPEQADSGGEDIDTRADVYSLGVIFYEILVGSRPLDCAKLAFSEVLRRIREEDAPRPSTKLRTLPAASALIAKNRRTEAAMLGRQIRGDLDSIALKSLEKDRSRRYGSPSELAADLQRFLRNEPVSAGPATAAYRAGKFVSKHRWWMAAAAAFAAMLAIAAAVSTREAIRADRERDRAVAAGREANAQKLTAYAIASLTEDPERSIALAMHAVNSTLQFHQGIEPAAEAALHSALMASHVRMTLRGHQDSVIRVVFSPDGRLIATCGWDETAKIWSAATGQELLTLRGHPGRLVTSVAFSPDSKRVVTGGADGIAKVWDAITGRELLVLAGHTGSVEVVAFQSGGRIATASRGRAAQLWDADSGSELQTLGGPKGGAWCMDFSPDGNRLLTCGARLTIWNAATGRELLSLSGRQRPAMRAVFSPDGRRIVTAGRDNFAEILDAESGKVLFSLRGHKRSISWAAFSPDGQRVATSSSDQTVKVWDATDGQELVTLPTGTGVVNCVAFSPDGSRLAGASSDKTVKLWDLADPGELVTLHGHEGALDVAFSPDGERIAIADGDKAATVWDAARGQELIRLRGHDDEITTLRFSPDGKRLATASRDKTAKLWDSYSGHEILTLRGHQADLTCVNFSSDGSRLATSSLDNTVKIWDAVSGRESIALRDLDHQVACAEFSGDGKRIAAASSDGKVVVWDAIAGAVLLTWRAGRLKDHLLTTVAFSRDGKRAAAAAANTISVWSGSSGQEVATLHQGPSKVTMVRFSPDGSHLAAANLDGTATLWNAADGKETLNLRSGGGRLISVAFSADGRRLATAEIGGAVRVYALDIGELLALARKRVTRPLTVPECRTYFQAETCPALP